MRGRKGKGLRISDPFVAISSNMGGIPPARFANCPIAIPPPEASLPPMPVLGEKPLPS